MQLHLTDVAGSWALKIDVMMEISKEAIKRRRQLAAGGINEDRRRHLACSIIRRLEATLEVRDSDAPGNGAAGKAK